MSSWAGYRPSTAVLVFPAAVFGSFLAAVTAWLVGPWAAAVVMAGCLGNAWLLAWIVERFRNDASAQLRRPELRGAIGYQAGVFGPLLSEALQCIEELERRSAEAMQAKTELEARLHVGRRRQRHLTGAVDLFGDAILLTDTLGRVLYANIAASRLLNYDETQSQRGPATGSFDPKIELTPAIAETVRQILQRPGAACRTAEFATDDSETPTHRAVTRPIFDEDGQLLGTTVQVTDIQHEHAENQRHAEFVSSVCHELKTPMSSIRAYTELLHDGDYETEDERVELCTFIEGQIDRLTRLINNMLNLARMESGVIKVQREDCELNDVLGPAIETVRQLADEKSVQLICELSELYLAVHVDKDLLGQAVINLLSNAVKYTPSGGEVRLRTRLDEERAVIEVKDTGMGIPAESLPKLFDRFYRVPQNMDAAPGTGLGLALVKYIATDLHNGSIAVQSEVGAGSTFSISLPFGHRDRLPRREQATGRLVGNVEARSEK